MNRRMTKKIPMIIGLAFIAVAAFSGVVMVLWNSILVSVLHVSAITFLQAAGILLLSKILFGGMKGRGPMGGFMWKKRMFMKWQGMTPEQQEQWSSKMRSCCGGFGDKKDVNANAA